MCAATYLLYQKQLCLQIKTTASGKVIITHTPAHSHCTASLLKHKIPVRFSVHACTNKGSQAAHMQVSQKTQKEMQVESNNLYTVTQQ